MRNIILFILVTFLPVSHALANEQWLGSFSGNETMTLTGCKHTQYNGTIERDWSVTHEELNGNEYTGTGKTPGEPAFSVSGTIDGNTAKGMSHGRDQWGNAWSSTSDVKLEGDDLTVSYKGSSASSGCRFTGEITAKRQ